VSSGTLVCILVRHLVLRDPGRDLGVTEILALDLVEVCQVVEQAAPDRAAHALRIRQVEHRVTAAAKGDALVFRRQESAPPVKS
jgi:hypothetical protein